MNLSDQSYAASFASLIFLRNNSTLKSNLVGSMANAATTASTNGAAKASASQSQHESATNAQPKRGKAKKNADPINTTKEIEDRIAQLEKNKAGEKDQEAEIGA